MSDTREREEREGAHGSLSFIACDSVIVVIETVSSATKAREEEKKKK